MNETLDLLLGVLLAALLTVLLIAALVMGLRAVHEPRRLGVIYCIAKESDPLHPVCGSWADVHSVGEVQP